MYCCFTYTPNKLNVEIQKPDSTCVQKSDNPFIYTLAGPRFSISMDEANKDKAIFKTTAALFIKEKRLILKDIIFFGRISSLTIYKTGKTMEIHMEYFGLISVAFGSVIFVFCLNT